MLLTLLKETSGGGGVTASVVGVTRTPSDGTDATGASLALTIPAGTAIDDYAVIIVELWDSTATNPTLTYPSGFSQIVNYVSTTDGFQKLKVAIKALTAADSGTYSVSGFASHFRQGHVAILRGIDLTTALDVAVNLAQNSTGTALPANSITTVTDGCLLMHVIAAENTCTGLPATGYTEQADSNYTKTNTKIQTTAGSDTPSGGSVSASTLKLGALIAFRPAVSSGTTGTVAVTQANNTSTASGQLGCSGTSARTEAADTSSAAGTVVNPVTGTSAVTQANQTSSASGQLGYSGTSARTQAANTSAASGQLGYSGTSALTQANQTSTASGSFTAGGSFSGTASPIEAADTSTASGQLGYSGSSARTQANQTSSAAGAVVNPVTGTASPVQANQTSSGVGKLGYTGTAARTQANQTANATGAVVSSITGSAAASQANQTASISGYFAALVAFGTASAAVGPSPAAAAAVGQASTASTATAGSATASSGVMTVPTATGG